MHKFILFLITSFSICKAGAQIVVYGKTYDSITQKPVALATITNLSKGRTAIADYDGRFQILAEPGNVLVSSFTGYTLDTFRISQNNMKDTLLIRMRVLGEFLPEAIITAKSRYTQYQLDSMKRRMEYADVLDRSKQTLIGGPAEGSGFGVTINLGRGKKERERRNFKTQFELMEEQAYVSYHYVPQKVAEITGLKDARLIEFMNTYRPQYDWLRKHQTDEDMLDFINSKMKDFRKKGKLS